MAFGGVDCIIVSNVHFLFPCRRVISLCNCLCKVLEEKENQQLSNKSLKDRIVGIKQKRESDEKQTYLALIRF